MKYLLIAALTIFTSCGITPPTPAPPATIGDNVIYIQSAYTPNGVNDFYIYSIDSCEYIGTDALSSNMAFLTHKGNCKYCTYRNEKK